jgi:hypothetical protein
MLTLLRGREQCAQWGGMQVETMARVFDVAQYILQSRGPMTAMKLQKLVYYCQAWSTVWDDDAIFPDRIEAWENGPVCPALWERHRGQFKVSDVHGNPDALSGDSRETADLVLAFYGRAMERRMGQGA